MSQERAARATSAFVVAPAHVAERSIDVRRDQPRRLGPGDSDGCGRTFAALAYDARYKLKAADSLRPLERLQRRQQSHD